VNPAAVAPAPMRKLRRVKREVGGGLKPGIIHDTGLNEADQRGKPGN
jgi:hypothetical protein